MKLKGQHILITGAALRIGRAIALHLAASGANIALHYGKSHEAAKKTQSDIQALGVDCRLFQADLQEPEAALKLINSIEAHQSLDALINNASIFGDRKLLSTSPDDWNEHFAVNLSAPFFLSQHYFRSTEERNANGRIINILDWRALRPGADHLAYTISKSALAALTRSLAIAMAPTITVNGIALGAILPPSYGSDTSHSTDKIPMRRWAELEEVGQTIEFLLAGPEFITGEIIHLDGGRHLL